MPKREVVTKPPSHRLESARTLVLYGITKGGEGFKELSTLSVDPAIGASSMGTHV